MIVTWIFVILISIATGFAAGWIFRQFIGQKHLAKASSIANKIIDEAKIESENLRKEKLLEAKDEIFQLKQELEIRSKNKTSEIQRHEKHLSNRELNLDRKVDVLNKKEKELNLLNNDLRSKESYIRKKELELDNLIQEENRRLEQISGLTNEEAKKIQMQNMIEIVKKETANEIQEIREQTKKTAVREAREIMLQALQKSSISHVVDTTVSLVNLKDDEMKGRIIGREGRNIRAFESATGIEVLIDDTPQTVVLSGFDAIRREIAKLSLEKLIYDGRIHPGRIEEVVEKSREEINDKIHELGEQTIQEFGLHGIHTELIRLVGKQHYRTTYGQNLLQHSKEVAKLAGELASLVGLEVSLAQRAGILHDIGKTSEEYCEQPTQEIGVEIAKKFGEGEVVQNVIASQSPTNEVTILSPITILVQVADAISVSRPGAQKEMLENYIKRMSTLEQIACAFAGVNKAYAIQAGREIRVIVEHTLVDDTKAQTLANDIVQKINTQMEFPGQIKVAVIREYRSVDYAK